MDKRITSRKFRLFQYADCCVQARKAIDLSCAIGRGMVRIDSLGRVIEVSNDVRDLGNYTERGHKRVNGESVANYFA